MPEPWLLIAGGAAYLPVCSEVGVLNRTIYLPYGATEGQPSYPSTNLGFDSLRAVLAERIRLVNLLDLFEVEVDE